MHLLVFGAGGQLGREVGAGCIERELKWSGLERRDADITVQSDIENAIVNIRPTCVINATAYTAVDNAEADADAAYAVNHLGPSILADICSQRQIPLIHVSTDYVFDGTKSSAYVERDPTSPLGVYGMSKEAGERAIRTRHAQHIIIRTAWLYSQFGNNFLKTMMRLAATKDQWGVVADQIGTPTSATDVAQAILSAAVRSTAGDAAWGTFHFAGTEEMSWHGFAMAIVKEQAKYTARTPRVVPITTEQYPTPARRPKNSRLDSSLFQSTFGFRATSTSVRIAETVKALQASLNVPS